MVHYHSDKPPLTEIMRLIKEFLLFSIWSDPLKNIVIGEIKDLIITDKSLFIKIHRIVRFICLNQQSPSFNLSN